MKPLIQVRNVGLIDIPTFAAADGSSLSFAESNVHTPFEIKRIYYIYEFNESGITRGGHAHKELEQVFLCLNGNFVMRVDDGVLKQELTMNNRNNGIYIGPSVWHDMVAIDQGTVILALASNFYNESDYLRDYSQFLDHISI